MEYRSAGPFVSGFSPSAACFQGSFVVEQVSCFILFFLWPTSISPYGETTPHLSVHLAADTVSASWLSRMRNAATNVLVPASAFSV